MSSARRLSSAVSVVVLLFLSGCCATNRPGLGIKPQHEIPGKQKGKGRLFIVKDNNLGDQHREIAINGRYIGSLYSMSFMVVVLSPGKYTVDMSNKASGDVSSASILVDIANGKDVYVRLLMLHRVNAYIPKFTVTTAEHFKNIKSRLRQARCLSYQSAP